MPAEGAEANMVAIPEDMRYTNTHEWAKPGDGGEITLGITDYAQEEMGEIVMVELPEADTKVKKGDVIGSIEAVKTAEDFYSPIDATIVRVNDALEGAPNLINESPYDEGWLLVLVSDTEGQLEQLMSAEQYKQFLGE